MTDTIHNTILPMTDTTAEPEDYTGEDGLLYCGKCRKPKEAYFPEGKTFFGRDRHPSECDCQRAARKEREAAEKRRSHNDFQSLSDSLFCRRLLNRVLYSDCNPLICPGLPVYDTMCSSISSCNQKLFWGESRSEQKLQLRDGGSIEIWEK